MLNQVPDPASQDRSCPQKGKAGRVPGSKKGNYKWPIEEGCVAKLTSSRWVKNKSTGRGGHHECYVWVLVEYKRQEDEKNAHERRVRVNFTYVPMHPDIGKYFNVCRIMQIESLTRYYRKHGIRVIARDCIYRGNDASTKRFYKMIGLIK